MRSFIDAARPLSESHDMLDLVREIRDSVAPNFAGQCEGAAAELMDRLQAAGLDAKFVEGRVNIPHEYEGDKFPWSGHCWVETSDMILDPTAEQFGLPLVVHKGDPGATIYDDTPLQEQIVHRDQFVGDHNSRKTVVAINPSKGEWASAFPKGAAGILLKDGRIVVGDGNALDHLRILELASIPDELEAYRLQICRNIAWAEVWINEDAPQDTPEEVHASVLAQYGEGIETIAAKVQKAIGEFAPMECRAIPLNSDQDPLLPGDAEFIGRCDA